jgi:GPH family glycoside/pentoside/hexuronide:cation symporter
MVSLLPTGLFTVLMFYPWYAYEHPGNYGWLMLMQAGFYVSLTLYIVPYNALMPELARGREEKLRYSTVLSFMYVAGLIVASQLPQLAELAGKVAGIGTQTAKYQLAILLMAGFALVMMIVPVLFVNERRHGMPVPSSAGLLKSLGSSLRNRRFMLFLAADASFFLTLAIVSSAALYYVTVLLGLPESYASRFFAMLILASFVYYPFIGKLTRRFGRKRLILASFLVFAGLFGFVFYLGRLPMAAPVQLVVMAGVASFPVAVLAILPFSLVAEMAEEAAERTGEKTEGMYFAVRTFADKIGQTLGVMVFAVFTVFGKDPGHDLGIRLSAAAGMVICLLAFIFFLRFRE